MTTAAILVSIFKYSLIVLGTILGIYGTTNEYKTGGRLTPQGRIAIWVMALVGVLTIVSAAFEQYLSYENAQAKIRREWLSAPLTNLAIKWNISPEAARAFSEAMQHSQGDQASSEHSDWPLYIATAEYGGKIDVQKSILGWILVIGLERPQGLIVETFDQGTPAWAAFERAIRPLIGDHFELSLVNGASVVNISWPMELTIDHSTISFHISSPFLNPLDLSNSTMMLEHRGAFRPAQIHISTTDPRVEIDKWVSLKWHPKVWLTPASEGEAITINQFESAPFSLAMKTNRPPTYLQ